MKRLETVKCHPMPSPDDEEGNKFGKKVIDRMKEAEGVNGMIIYSFVRFDIMQKTCMNTSLIKRSSLIVERNFNRDEEFNAMIINLILSSIAMDALNDTNKSCLIQMRVIEYWWDGIGN